VTKNGLSGGKFRERSWLCGKNSVFRKKVLPKAGMAAKVCALSADINLFEQDEVSAGQSQVHT
jgi:hypothetical protein